MLQPCPDVLQQTSDPAFGGEGAWQLSSDLLELSFFCRLLLSLPFQSKYLQSKNDTLILLKILKRVFCVSFTLPLAEPSHTQKS